MAAALQEEQKEARKTKAREKEAKRLRLRAKSIKELVETEIQYVADLEVLTEIYVEPLSPSNSSILNAEQHRLLFNNIPALIKLNTQFKVGLCARYNKDWDPHTSVIAPEFLQFAPYFHMYQGYLNSHEQAAGLVAKLYIRSSKFKKFIDAAQCNPKCKNLNLSSYLVKPLQRITKYSLLLRELRKHTTSAHPDYGDLQLAQMKIDEVNATINEKMKTFDQRQKVRDIQARFTQNNIDLVSPARYFIKEGKLTKICRKKDVVYIFILFSDLLIYGEQTNSGSEDNYQIKIHQQIPINQSFKTRDIPQNAKYGAKCWEIHSPEKSFIVYADHPGLKQEWLREMERVVRARNTIESGKQRPAALWVPDDFTTTCMIPDCDHKFNVINRRHHCRYCGRLVCGPCSPNKLPHWNKTNKSVRVCSVCYTENKELKHVKKSTDAHVVIGDQIVAENDEDSLSVESDIDFEFWDSTESEEEEDHEEEMGGDTTPVSPPPIVMEDTLQSINNMAEPMTRSRSSNINGKIGNTTPQIQISTRPFVRRSAKKNRRARMLTKEQIKALHGRSASLGARSASERLDSKAISNRGIFSHQAKIFRLSHGHHTPKKSTRALYELYELSLPKRPSMEPMDAMEHNHSTHLQTNSLVSESMPPRAHTIHSASSGDIYGGSDEKRNSPFNFTHSNQNSLVMPQGASFTSSGGDLTARHSGKSNRRLKLVGTGTLNIEAHQYDHELVSMRLHTFTEVIDWNLDPYSMKPKQKDSFSCYLKARNVLSQQSEILLVRIKNKDIMASLVTILLSLGYYYEAENANRDDEDMDSQVMDGDGDGDDNTTIALSKDTTLEEQKAEIDRAVFLIENSKKHENIKTIDVAKFLLAKSCPISVIQHAFTQAGVIMPAEVHSLAAMTATNSHHHNHNHNNNMNASSKNQKLREKEKRIGLKNGKRGAGKTSKLLSTGFHGMRMHKQKRAKSGDFGDAKSRKQRFIKPIKLKQSYSADVESYTDKYDEDYVQKEKEEKKEEWFIPHAQANHVNIRLPDADSDSRYQEALCQHDIRFCVIDSAAELNDADVYMPSDKLDEGLRDIINHNHNIINNRAPATNTLATNTLALNGKRNKNSKSNIHNRRATCSAAPTTKERKRKKKQKKKFSIWGNKRNSARNRDENK